MKRVITRLFSFDIYARDPSTSVTLQVDDILPSAPVSRPDLNTEARNRLPEESVLLRVEATVRGPDSFDQKSACPRSGKS